METKIDTTIVDRGEELIKKDFDSTIDGTKKIEKILVEGKKKDKAFRGRK